MAGTHKLEDDVGNNQPFGFDPEDLDRLFPGAGEQLRDVLGRFGGMLNSAGERAGRSGAFDQSGRRPGRRPSRRRPARPATGCG